VVREIQPRIATVRVQTEPAGIPVRVLGGAEAPSPQQARVIDGSSASIAAPQSAWLDGEAWTFVRWADGSTDPDRVVEARGTTTRTAIYQRPATPPTTGPLAPPEPEPALDVLGPRLRIDAAHTRRVAPRLRVRVRCNERCTVVAHGTLHGLGGKRLPVVKRHIAPGRTIRLTLRLDRRVGAVRRALRAGRRVSLRLVITATDAAGNQVTRRATVRLRR
jgi:hypothetical protein